MLSKIVKRINSLKLLRPNYERIFIDKRSFFSPLAPQLKWWMKWEDLDFLSLTQEDTKMLDPPHTLLNETVKRTEISDEVQDHIHNDKTNILLEMINGAGRYFLARSKGFGANILHWTLWAIFEGKKNFFEGLYLDNSNTAFWRGLKGKRFSVISLNLELVDWRPGSRESLEKHLSKLIEREGYRHFIRLKYNAKPENMLVELIHDLFKKNKNVVLLINNYDALLLRFYQTGHFEEIYQCLGSLFQIVKQEDRYFNFVLVSGTTADGQKSLFSGLGELRDISQLKKSEVLLESIEQEIKWKLATLFQNKTKEEIIADLKENCSGSNFSVLPKHLIYCINLYDLYNHFLENNETLQVLLNVVNSNNKLLTYENAQTSKADVLTPLNVKSPTNNLPMLGTKSEKICPFTHLRDGNYAQYFKSLYSILNYVFYRPTQGRRIWRLCHARLATCHKAWAETFDDANVVVEPSVLRGEPDIKILFRQDKKVYIFEAKVDLPVEEGMKRILRKYAQKYTNDDNIEKVVMVSICFDRETMNIGSALVEEYNKDQNKGSQAFTWKPENCLELTSKYNANAKPQQIKQGKTKHQNQRKQQNGPVIIYKK